VRVDSATDKTRHLPTFPMAEQSRRLDSWKEIADYVGKDVRTAMRWAKSDGLPVRRVAGVRGRSVFAFTGEIDASDDNPDDVPTLSVDGLSVRQVYRSLTRAGFTDDLLLSAAGGLTIRPSTEAMPFGPPAAPRGQTYAHVAIEERGQVTDVWVSLADGTVYRYER